MIREANQFVDEYLDHWLPWLMGSKNNAIFNLKNAIFPQILSSIHVISLFEDA
jgi:hypothetical protein